jgi:transposase
MLLASAGGNRVPVIAQLVQADEDTVRDVIHRFNEIGLACLDPNSLVAAPARLLEQCRTVRVRDCDAFLDPG